MKILSIITITFTIILSGCAKKAQPKLCTITIPEPSKEELKKFNGEYFGKKK